MTVSTESQGVHRLRERIAELRELEDGWLDGDQGHQIHDTVVSRSEEALCVMETCGNIATAAFPTVEGGVEFAWKGNSQLTMEFQPDGSVYVHKITGKSYSDEAIPATEELADALARWLA